MTTKFRIWSVLGQKPEWGAAKVIRAESFGVDAWIVVVEGDGSDLERFIKSRRDLFTLYERMPAFRGNPAI
jgi:hypothetical protein